MGKKSHYRTTGGISQVSQAEKQFGSGIAKMTGKNVNI